MPWADGLFDQFHVGFFGQFIALLTVALKTTANHILPSRFAASTGGNHMIKAQLSQRFHEGTVLTLSLIHI